MTNDESGKRGPRIPPHNIEAEEALLGAMLLSRDAIMAAEQLLTAVDFYKPLHVQLYAAMTAVYASGSAVDPVTIAEYLRQHGQLEQLGGPGQLARIQAATPASANAPHYARIVAQLAAVRRALTGAAQLADAAYDAFGRGDTGGLHQLTVDTDAVGELVQLAHTIGDRIEVPGAVVDPAVLLEDLVAMEFDYRWLVPGLVRRMDRIMLTGLEGFSGKTEHNFQWAVQFASGIHPWTRAREFPPLRVTYMDFENALDQLAARARRLCKAAGDAYRPGQLHVRALPEGLNIRSARGFGFLDAVCERDRPDVLILGPIYRMFEGERGMAKHSEEVAEDVTRRLDRLRVRHNLALMIEAHAPHGSEGDRANLRPYGASLWMRWPEIGVGLAPMKTRDPQTRKLVLVPGKFTYDFWRGTRDQDLRRPWPTAIQRWNNWSFIPAHDEEAF